MANRRVNEQSCEVLGIVRTGAYRSSLTSARYRGLFPAVFCREMPDVVDDLPEFFILHNAFPGGHSGGKDSVFYNPLQLAVGIALDCGRIELRHRRRHLLGKNYARILAVQPVAVHAVAGENHAPGMNVGWGKGKRVLVRFSSYRDLLFGEACYCGLPGAGLADFAAGQEEQQYQPCQQNL